MVSVIIPIYNVERYLKQCLRSVLGQTYKDMEIILVNDASPDGSLTICEQFAARDPRVRIIDKKTNEGVDMARFTGLGAARGEYVYFIDPDDWLARRDIIELMVNKADETGVDYVLMNSRKIMGRTSLINSPFHLPQTGLITKAELHEKYYLGCFGWPQLSPNMWDKLFRRSFISETKIDPSKLRFGQDVAFNLRVFPLINKIYVLDMIGYNYRFGGLTASLYKKEWFEAQKQLYKLRVQEAAKNNFSQGDYQSKLQLLAMFESNLIGALAVLKSRFEMQEMFAKELGDPFWDDILRPDEYPDMFRTPFMKALAARDVDTMIALSSPAARKMRMTARLKRIANAVLSRL